MKIFRKSERTVSYVKYKRTGAVEQYLIKCLREGILHFLKGKYLKTSNKKLKKGRSAEEIIYRTGRKEGRREGAGEVAHTQLSLTMLFWAVSSKAS